VAFGSDGFSI